MTEQSKPLAFIYDRHVTVIEDELDRRLNACMAYLSEHGWDFAGQWIDRGDHALTDDHRPEFDALLRAITAAGDRPRVCLIHDWGRLSHDMATRGLMTRRVLLLGGWVETCRGEKRTPDGRYLQVPAS